MEAIPSNTVAPGGGKGGGVTTEKAAGVIAVACIAFLALVRKGFSGVLHP